MNWGKGIAILYISFVVFIAFMVYMAFGEKYDLVTEDYYQQEIEFQSTIDKRENAKNLTSSLKVSINHSSVIIDFPQKNVVIEGMVNVFRPSDESLDFDHEFSSTKDQIEIPLKKFTSGKYLIKTEWKVDNNAFYQEETIIIP